MPIYAYRCESCGHAKDVLQKMSDAALSTCPACGQDSFRKQVTAAGFQLKGSGWYATDFRGGGAPASGSAKGDAGESASPASPAGSESAGSAASAGAPGAGSGGCGGSCACH